jgi:hypothetical protein
MKRLDGGFHRPVDLYDHIAIAARAAQFGHARDHGQHQPANGASPLQSVLSEMAGSLTLSAKPRATLFVTEQPTWALVYNGPSRWWCRAGATDRRAHDASWCRRGHHRLQRHLGVGDRSGPVSINQALAPNSASIVPTGSGPFSVTATCTAGWRPCR